MAFIVLAIAVIVFISYHKSKGNDEDIATQQRKDAYDEKIRNEYK